MAGAPDTEAATGALRERRLAAVVFTDVVGYSAMVQADEAAGLRRVATDLATMRVTCASRGGEFLNSMGDGLMLAFDSAVAAVEFAVQTQRGFGGRNASASERDRVQHRIGIHVGDVFRTAEGQLAGDGVNIAARLEGAAPPGGVCVSQSVRDLVRGKTDFSARFGGARAFKNIEDPVAIWTWHPEDGLDVPVRQMPRIGMVSRRTAIAAGAGSAAALAAGIAWWVHSRVGAGGIDKSLAVLPFVNMGEDKDATWFADGIHEDLLTQLALLGDLKVVSRTSVMEYRNTTKKMAQIGSELKVAALVEGSVRKSGDTVRVTAQLIDAHSDKHIWAANYDRSLKDAFKVQNDLAKEIAGSLNVSLTAAEEKRLARAPTQNQQAYEHYLRSQQMVRDAAGTVRAVSSLKDRVDLLQKAVELDPKFFLAWSRLASERARMRGFGLVDDRPRELALAQEAMARAKALAPDDPQVKIDEAALLLHGMDDQQGAVRMYEEVLKAAPYNVDALVGLAEVLGRLNRIPESVQMLERALAVDARHTVSMTRLSITLGEFRHYDRTLELRRKLVDMRPDELDRQAGWQWWYRCKTGRWEEYDRWRATLAKGAEQRMARVKVLDGDRALARGDFAAFHKLVDTDSSDSSFRTGEAPLETQGVLLAIHALAWRAQGDNARARQSARESLAKLDAAARRQKAFDSWGMAAYAHAVLGDRAAALDAHEKDLALDGSRGNQWDLALDRRNRVMIDALLGDEDKALAALEQLVRRPGFHIHEATAHLPLARLWKHPRFLALVADPASAAPLPLDTPP